jgi:hypothetical protein
MTDWRRVGLDNCFLLRTLRLYSFENNILKVRVSGDLPSKSSPIEAVETMKEVINLISTDLNFKDVEYFTISNFSIIFLADDKILKVFNRQPSSMIAQYDFAKSVVGENIPGLVKYFDTWISKSININGRVSEGPVYAILMQKCQELTKFEKNLFNNFHSILKLDKKSSSITKEEMMRVLNNESDRKYLINEFIDLFFSLRGKVILDDFRGDNLGRIDGNLVHFDPMSRVGFS